MEAIMYRSVHKHINYYKLEGMLLVLSINKHIMIAVPLYCMANVTAYLPFQ